MTLANRPNLLLLAIVIVAGSFMALSPDIRTVENLSDGCNGDIANSWVLLRPPQLDSFVTYENGTSHVYAGCGHGYREEPFPVHGQVAESDQSDWLLLAPAGDSYKLLPTWLAYVIPVAPWFAVALGLMLRFAGGGQRGAIAYAVALLLGTLWGMSWASTGLLVIFIGGPIAFFGLTIFGTLGWTLQGRWRGRLQWFAWLFGAYAFNLAYFFVRLPQPVEA